MASYITVCNLCSRNFTTSKALLNHRVSKHHVRESLDQPSFLLDGVPIELPNPSNTGNNTDYKSWLSGIVESINSSLNPKASGKWCRVECEYCSLLYLQALLHSMPSVIANSVKTVSHWKPPVWKQSATKISYKCYDMDEVRAALNMQSAIPLVEHKAFSGFEEIADVTGNVTGRDAIALAKARVRGQKSDMRMPTCRSSLIVGPGEGRATREFEIIWWSDLYSAGEHGKVIFRFYVAKTLNP